MKCLLLPINFIPTLLYTRAGVFSFFLKEKYPYLLQITYQSLEKLKTNQTASSLDVEKQSPIEIFKEFYEKMKGEAMSQESEEIIQQLLEEVSEDDAH